MFTSYIYSSHQRTPLHTAAAAGHTDTVRCLVDKAADINIKNTYGVSDMADKLVLLIRVCSQSCDQSSCINSLLLLNVLQFPLTLLNPLNPLNHLVHIQLYHTGNWQPDFVSAEWVGQGELGVFTCRVLCTCEFQV